MKAIVLTGIERMELRDVADRRIAADDDVRIRVAAVGVCGSDMHYYREGRIGSQVVRYPFIVGHECAGVVESVGPAVRRVRPGDRVAVDPAMSCGACDQCRAGRHHTCRKIRFLGCPGQAEGALAEHLVMPEACCFAIPDAMTMAEAAGSEPLAIGVYTVTLAGDVCRKSIGILGFGPIGMSVLLAAKAAGAERIYVTDRIDARIGLAKAEGATWAGTPDEIADALGTREPDQLDLVFECAGKQETLDQGVDLLKPGGKLLVIGIPDVERVSYAADSVRRKEIAIQNVRRQVGCVERTLALIADKQVTLDRMLTHTLPFERTKDAFDLVAGYRDGVMKAIVEIG
jgi:L-iditol 2-dehydrogenase